MRQRPILTPESFGKREMPTPVKSWNFQQSDTQIFSGREKMFLTFSLTVDNETIKLDKDDYWVAKGCHLIIFYVTTGIERQIPNFVKETTP